jgi:hypothetical protein
VFNCDPPRFPAFHWNHHHWVTAVELPSWRGFQIRNGPYGAISADGESDGVVHVLYAPEGRPGRAPLDDDEIAAVHWLIANERAVHDATVARMLEALPDIRSELLDCLDEDEVDRLLPSEPTVAALKRCCGVISINIHPLSKDGQPFIGVGLGCTWAAEHGAGVLLHGARALEFGGEDTAILLWMARRHANAG